MGLVLEKKKRPPRKMRSPEELAADAQEVYELAIERIADNGTHFPDLPNALKAIETQLRALEVQARLAGGGEQANAGAVTPRDTEEQAAMLESMARALRSGR